MGRTEESVRAIAPDAKSMTAAKPVARATSWATLGRDRASPGGNSGSLWGMVPGSKGAYYVVAYLTDEDAVRYTDCSCPSAKRPCKHVLALLLLDVAGQVPDAPMPDDHTRLARYASNWE